MSTLDIDTVQAFLLVAELQSFTRAAEALGTTQAAVSLKLQRLESVLGKRLVERSPRAVALTADGAAFLPHARVLMEAHDRALSGETPARQQLSLGISRSRRGTGAGAAARAAACDVVAIGAFRDDRLFARDAGCLRCRQLDAVVVRQEGSRRGGEKLTEDEFGWFAAKRLVWRRGETLPLATLAPPCGVRALAVRALDKAGIAWSEPLSAAASPRWPPRHWRALRSRRWPGGSPRRVWSISGRREGLPQLSSSKVMLHSKVSDPAKLVALRTLAATFRSVVAAAKHSVSPA